MNIVRYFKKYWLYISIILISILGVVSAFYPHVDKPMENEDDILSDMKISKKIIDLGTVMTDTVLKAKYMLYNVADSPLEIKSVQPDCSCTDYKLSKYCIQKGDSSLLTLLYNTKDKLGEQELHTIIKANTKEQFYIVILKVKCIR